MSGEQQVASSLTDEWAWQDAHVLPDVVDVAIDHLGWFATLASGSAFALTGAALWLLIRIRE